MTLTVQVVEGPAVDAVLREGVQHPVFGGLIDLGTVARLAGPAITVAAVTELCCELTPRVRLVRGSEPSRAELEAQAARGPLFVVLVGPVGMVIAAGPDLPAMGPMPGCDLDLLAASMRAALGEQVEDSLFTEASGAWSNESERNLDARLRQLYGQ